MNSSSSLPNANIDIVSGVGEAAQIFEVGYLFNGGTTKGREVSVCRSRGVDAFRWMSLVFEAFT